MCDEKQLAEMGRAPVNRRQFAKIAGLAGLAASAPLGSARAQGRLTESDATFDAPGGRMDAYFAYPSEGRHPAIIVWPDIAGVRDAFISMGRRLAREGYAVLVLNPYYRDLPAPQFEDFDDWRAQGGIEKVAPWREKLTSAAVMETAAAVVAWLDIQDPVDATKGIGTQGFCMGGPFTVWTAAAAPTRVKAAASFHGGGLVGEDETSPVKMLGQTQASFLFAIARNDDRTAPGDKDALRAAAEAAGRPADIRVFRGDHGWMVADSPVYDYEEEDAAWERLLALYSTAL